ncbi:MAG: TldD/PmbA family protein [Trueperaceae bacterium]|nr:TldD/PmbA family protein [Trueperaceae bacterium]
MTFEAAKDFLIRRAGERSIAAEVLATSERRLSLSVKGGSVDELTAASRGGVGIRVVVEGKVGYASTEALDTESLEWVLDEAVENAALQHAEGAVLVAGRALGRHDLLGEGLSAEVADKVAGVLDLESGLRADARVDVVYQASYRESEAQAVIGSTAGADGGYRNGYASYSATPIMKLGDSVKQGSDVDISKEFHALDPNQTAHKVLERVGRHLGATPLGTGRYRGYLESEVTATLLALLLYSLSGKTLAEGKSRLAGKLGARVASDLITLVDDPTLVDGPASRPFDAEGTPAARTEIISGGVLQSFLHNSDTARRTGHTNTGHASRSYASTLGVSPSNLVLATGTGIDVSDGVIVTDLMGVHAGANPISGDVSVQGLGLRVTGGETHPVDNFALSFNLFSLLERIDAVGEESTWTPTVGMFRAPMVAVDALSFSGA